MNNCCPLCASSNTSEYVHLDYCMASDASKVNEAVDVYLCQACTGVYKVYASQVRAKKVINEVNERSTLHAVHGKVETRVAYDKYHKGMSKSAYIFQFIAQHTPLNKTGALLDIGCHFGAFLQAFSQAKPDWILSGCDVSDRFKSTVEKIGPHVSYYSNTLPSIARKYDLITVSHVLEHVDDLDELLTFISDNLTAEGLFFLQCNNIADNPFLPLVFEQYYNFSTTSLSKLCAKHGLFVQQLDKHWINKEISVIFSKNKPLTSTTLTNDISSNLNKIEHNQQFFQQTLISLQQLVAENKPVALFGTTYSAKWVSYFKDLSIACFVDENPMLIGSFIDGIEVLSPDKVPENIPILLVFPQAVAQRIQNRLAPEIKAELRILP